MAERHQPQVYSIAAHRGFADALVAGLVPRYSDPEFGLARLTLLVPSSRARRTIAEAFIRHAGEHTTPGLLAGVRVAINAGPTREPVDPVRVLTNRSSGKMGFALAQALAQAGAEVRLIAGPVALDTPAGVQRIDVETAADMLDASLAAASEAEIFIGTAAIADYRPAQAEPGKIKKSASRLSLKLERTEDVISAVRKAHPELFIVGFAAETDDLAKYARDKLKRKGLDMVAANWVGAGRAFDQDHNALQVFWSDGEKTLAQAPKIELATALVELIAERLAAKRSADKPTSRRRSPPKKASAKSSKSR